MRTMDVIRFHCTRSRLCFWQQIGTSLSGSQCRTATLLSLQAYTHIYSVQPLLFNVGIPLLMYHLVTFWRNWKPLKWVPQLAHSDASMVKAKNQNHFSTHRELIHNKSANSYSRVYTSSNYMVLYRQCPFETKFVCLVGDSWGSWCPGKEIAAMQVCLHFRRTRVLKYLTVANRMSVNMMTSWVFRHQIMQVVVTVLGFSHSSGFLEVFLF